MTFDVNHPILFVIAGAIIALVVIQSVFFLLRALRRAKELGMNTAVLRKTILSSAVFTVAPAVSILVGVVVLSKKLGLALPWLRLSIIGSLSYETVAAEATLDHLGDVIAGASDYVTVLFVMTLGIAGGFILVPFCTKGIQKGLKTMEKRDKKWGEIFNNAMFLGMISAFLGYVFCDVSTVFEGLTWGLVPVCVMAASALIMVVCGLLSRFKYLKWMTDYALPLSLVGGMAAAIPLTAWLGAAPV